MGLEITFASRRARCVSERRRKRPVTFLQDNKGGYHLLSASRREPLALPAVAPVEPGAPVIWSQMQNIDREDLKAQDRECARITILCIGEGTSNRLSRIWNASVACSRRFRNARPSFRHLRTCENSHGCVQPHLQMGRLIPDVQRRVGPRAEFFHLC